MFLLLVKSPFQAVEGTMSKHRLKRDTLVESLFYLFSHKYDDNQSESIMDVRMSMDDIASYLKETYDVSYSDNKWIYKQIRNYEDEIKTRLFTLEKDREGGSFLRVNGENNSFTQKRHLYISQKIKVSNGIYDLIAHSRKSGRPDQAVKLFLGAGSTLYHLSNIIAAKAAEDHISCDIHTNNISVLNSILSYGSQLANIRISSSGGVLDPVTNTFIGPIGESVLSQEFDYIIQGTSFLVDGTLYVEHPEEALQKEALLKEAKGRKILVLTGHEVLSSLPGDAAPFGSLSDFDYLVVPHNHKGLEKNLDRMLREDESRFRAEIINWNYRIYRMNPSSSPAEAGLRA